MVRSEFIEKWKKYLSVDHWNNWGKQKGFRTWGHGGFKYVVDLLPEGNKKVLELGCADGYLLQLLKDKGCDPIGMTYAEGEYNECIERGLNVILGDVHDLPFDDNSFDAVITRQTLEHVLSPYVVFKEVERIVKTCGYFVIHVPLSYDGVDFILEHIYTLTPLQWKLWLEKHTSFRVISEGVQNDQRSYWLVAMKS